MIRPWPEQRNQFQSLHHNHNNEWRILQCYSFTKIHFPFLLSFSTLMKQACCPENDFSVHMDSRYLITQVSQKLCPVFIVSREKSGEGLGAKLRHDRKWWIRLVRNVDSVSQWSQRSSLRTSASKQVSGRALIT